MLKETETLDGRSFLIESVYLDEISGELEKLPEHEEARVDRSEIKKMLALRSVAEGKKIPLSISPAAGETEQANFEIKRKPMEGPLMARP